jgi:hypothetical protein
MIHLPKQKDSPKAASVIANAGIGVGSESSQVDHRKSATVTSIILNQVARGFNFESKKANPSCSAQSQLQDGAIIFIDQIDC